MPETLSDGKPIGEFPSPKPTAPKTGCFLPVLILLAVLALALAGCDESNSFEYRLAECKRYCATRFDGATERIACHQACMD